MGGSAVFVVKRGSDLIRFAVFLLVVASLVWYVVSRFGEWRSADARSGPPMLADGPGPVLGPERDDAAAEAMLPAEAPALAEAADGADYFAEYRIERERTRGALGDRLREVMASEGASPEVRQEAAAQYLELGRRAALESQAESLVRARGFRDVIVHLAEGSAQVVVKTESLSQQQVAQIIDTVSRITGVRATAITVMARAD